MSTIIPDAAPARHLSLVPPLSPPLGTLHGETTAPYVYTIPCPAWCAGHNPKNDDGSCDVHVSRRIEGPLDTTVILSRVAADPIMISLDGLHADSELTSAEVRELAARLLAAADLVDAERVSAVA